MYLTQGAPNMALHVAGDRTVVFGPASALRAALQRNRPATLSGPLKDAFGQLDFSRTVAAAMVIPQEMLAGGMGPSGMGPPGMGGMPPGGLDVLKKLQAMAIQAHVTGTDVHLAVTMLCAEAQAAEEMQKMIDGFQAMTKMGKVPPEAKKMLDSLKISRSGRNLQIQMTVDGAQFKPAIEAARQAAQRSKASLMPGPTPSFAPRPGGAPNLPGFPRR
jgi:hypothetical protein